MDTTDPRSPLRIDPRSTLRIDPNLAHVPRRDFLERNEFQDLVLQSVGRDLPMFGYRLFQSVPTTFAPVERIPVTPDYVIGPGDEIVIRAWGGVDIDYRSIVDRDGSIALPKVGSVIVAGIKFQDLQNFMKKAIGRSFRNFELTVTLGQLRSIHIFVVGDAARPGAYTVSSLSTLVNAVFASGGPSLRGSMRGIELKRKNRVVAEFDMYDLLVKGDMSKDAQLLPGDVIYIRPIGPLAAIAGSVNKPGIYELKGAATLGSLLTLAGGLATTADGQKAAVERIIERKTRKVDEFPLNSEGLAHAVRDGDLVKVLHLSPRFDNAVTVRGNVSEPARHPWRAGLRVKDVVPDIESLIVPDYWVRRNLSVRPDVTGRDVRGFRADIATELREGPMTEAADPTSSRSDWRPSPPIRTTVRHDLPEVNWEYAVLERLNRADLTTELKPFNLGKAILESDPQHNLELQPGDVITVFSKNDVQVPIAKQSKYVRLEGELAAPGVYQVRAGETLRHVVERAGGFTSNAYVYGSTFTREAIRTLQQKRLDELLDRLEQEIHRNMSQSVLTKEDADTLKAASQARLALVTRLRQVRATGRVVLRVAPNASQIDQLPNLPLEDADTFIVPSRPSTVTVLGTVYNQNAFIYTSDSRLSEYLAEAGGPTEDADTDRLYVVRADGAVLSKRQSKGGFFGIGSFDNGRVLPGDTIVVPEKLDRYSFTKELKDWSQILYQFALGVAGLKVLGGL